MQDAGGRVITDSRAGTIDVDSGEPRPVDGCPLDTQAPIPKPECNDARESTAGKWSAADQARWEANPSAIDVLIQVRGGGKACPAPDCPPRPNECPQQMHEIAYLQEWDWQSQNCVRALIEQVGGQATDERFWIIDVIEAYLTWPQIQAVGAHPHVLSIESNDTGALPP